MDSFMFLHPLSKELRIYGQDFSDMVSNEGVVSLKSNNGKIIKDLLLQDVIEATNMLTELKKKKSLQDLVYPLNVTFQITNNCNLNCVHCHRKNKNSRSISISQFKKIIKQLRKLNVFNINISGGEPLLRPELPTMIKIVNNAGMRATISSNAVLLTKEAVDNLYAAGLRNMQVSFDSYKPDKHDQIRGVKGAFEQMVSHLPLLRKRGIKFALVTSLIDQTPAEYSKIIDTAFRLGATAHKTNTVIPQGQARKIPTSKQLKDFSAYINIWKKKHKQYEDKMSVMAESMFALQIAPDQISPENAPAILKIGCPAAILTCNIDEAGNVTPCSFFPDLVLGNVLKNDFVHIWNGSMAKQLRERDRIQGCGVCSHKNTCGGCRARSYGMTGNMFQTDPYCFLNKSLLYEKNTTKK